MGKKKVRRLDVIKPVKTHSDTYLTPETVLNNKKAYSSYRDFANKHRTIIDNAADFIPVVGAINRFSQGDKIQGGVNLAMDATGLKSLSNFYKIFRSGNKLRKLRYMTSEGKVNKQISSLSKKVDSYSGQLTPKQHKEVLDLSNKLARKLKEKETIRQIKKSIPVKFALSNGVKAGSHNYISRDKLYEKVSPFDSYNPSKMLRNIFVGRENIFSDDDTAKDQIAASKLYAADRDKMNFYKGMTDDDFEYAMNQHVYNRNRIKEGETADELYAMYLGVPEHRRHFTNRLKKSIYKPNSYALPLTNKDWEDLYYYNQELPINKNTNSGLLGGFGIFNHAVGHGFDNNGEYISYGDSYDLNPFRGAARDETLSKLIDWYPKLSKRVQKINDLSLGIFNPIEIYDRKYIDDIYRVPKTTHALYLPELTVYGNKYKHGGTIHIKPENRGKFTATKRRTGKTTEELTHSKNPLTRKRAIFAQNARKWKHG